MAFFDWAMLVSKVTGMISSAKSLGRVLTGDGLQISSIFPIVYSLFDIPS